MPVPFWLSHLTTSQTLCSDLLELIDGYILFWKKPSSSFHSIIISNSLQLDTTHQLSWNGSFCTWLLCFHANIVCYYNLHFWKHYPNYLCDLTKYAVPHALIWYMCKKKRFSQWCCKLWWEHWLCGLQLYWCLCLWVKQNIDEIKMN